MIAHFPNIKTYKEKRASIRDAMLQGALREGGSIGKFLPWKLCAVFFLISIGIVLISVVILYNSSLSVEGAKLRAIATSHAALIDSVAEYDAETHVDFPNGGARTATLSQVLDAGFEEIGFGETGEFVIGEIRDQEINFLIPSRIMKREIDSVELGSVKAEAMGRALSGLSGLMYAQDYRGEEVLAWYEPLPQLNAGFVAKINVTELRGPYIKATLIGVKVSILLTVVTSLAFVWGATRFHDRADSSGTNSTRFSHKSGILTIFIASMVLIGIVSLSTVVGVLYGPSLERQKSELASLSAGMSSLINAVAAFDARTPNNTPNFDAAAATISQVKRAAENHPGFGESGEIGLAVLNGGMIEFVLPSRFTSEVPAPLNPTGERSQAMQRALSGEAGIVEGQDYRGVRVVAAFHPVSNLGAGFSAKMDLSEIRAPYRLTGAINASLAILLVMIGVLLAPQLIPKHLYEAQSRNRISISREPRLNSRVGVTLPGIVVVPAMALLVLLLDYLTPLGIAAGIPYIALIITASFFCERRGILIFTCLFTVLIVVGWSIAPSLGSEFYKVAVNRLYSVLTLWLAAIIILKIKAAEGQIRRSEEHLFSILESAPDATLIVAKSGQIEFANQQAERLFGYSKSEFETLSVDELVPHEVAPRHADLRASFLDTEHPRPMGQGLDLRALKKSGDTFPVEISLSPIDTEDGVLTAASIRDTTERKAAEEKIIRKEAELRMAMDNMPGAMIVVGPDMKIAAVNERYKEYYGDPDSIISPGNSMEDVLKSEISRGILRGVGTPDEILKTRMRSFKPERLMIFEDKTQDGRYLQLSRVPAPNDHTVTVAVDITERKQSEKIIANAMSMINDSIQYASRIQRSVLPTSDELSDVFVDHMVIWEPKDIVGGDIYLLRMCSRGALIMLLDCTGHGVPGAFMTMIATGAFDQALLENPDGDPAQLLKRTNQIVKTVLGQMGDEGESDDGFECGICLIDHTAGEITFAGARFELWILDHQEISVLKGDKAGIGYRRTDSDREFRNHTIEMSGTKSYYMGSDGIIDQIGGAKRLSFGKRRVKQIIRDYSKMNMSVQAVHILRAFEEYQHNEERRDDVTLIGFRPKT